MTRQPESREPEIAHPAWERLLDILRDMGSVVVAFSGGTDSSLLAAAAHRALGARALMVTAVSPTFPARDRQDVLALVEAYGWQHRFIATDELADANFATNPPDRCYHCKSELFRKLREIAGVEGYRWVADGANTDDDRDYRPGARAQRAWLVRSPIREAGMAKADVRAVARALGLAVADKPAAACLASRFPYGSPITAAKLAAVEQAETVLADMGFTQLRVRVHGDVARIELLPEELPRALAESCRGRIAAAVKQCGYRYVALDLEGYRMGSLNEGLATAETMPPSPDGGPS